MPAVPGKYREESRTPIVLMGALNPFLHHGLEAAARDAREAGADGFTIPDYPPEESEAFEAICKREKMAFVHLIAPTTPPERMARIARRSTGFVYYVSLKGVTGARAALASDLSEKLGALRKASDIPIAVGFGISTPEHAREVAGHADGVVVGSALVDVIHENLGKPAMLDEVRKFVGGLAAAVHGGARV